MASLDTYTASEAKKWAEREIICNSHKLRGYMSALTHICGHRCLPRLVLKGKVNKGGVLCNARLMSLAKPLGSNGRVTGKWHYLSITTASFTKRQNQCQLKPILAKTGVHLRGERLAEIATSSFNVSCWQALWACINLTQKLGADAFEQGRHGKSFMDQLIKAYIIRLCLKFIYLNQIILHLFDLIQ